MKKTNNKGFSLVELIIVIAIMAVLIAVMAPSFIKYVEQSRASTDMQNAAAIVSAVQVWAVDPNAGDTINGAATTALTTGQGTVTVTATNAAAIGGANAAGITSALKNAGLDPATIKCQAKTTWGAAKQYVITFDVKTDGSVAVTYNPAGVGGKKST